VGRRVTQEKEGKGADTKGTSKKMEKEGWVDVAKKC
jgi:hypothetical protein